MGFVNERVEEKDRRTFKNKWGKQITPSKWTINKEKNEILFCAGKNRESNFCYDFLFYYEGDIIEIATTRSVKDGICIWSFLSIFVPSKINK
ncbi:MAG: hypothetical protein IJV15_15265 [Lachnospiraceae bacterium]|nr:hypothetical protein [Lachnospiraceae bacterium]